MDFLSKIVEKKRLRVEIAKSRKSLADMRAEAVRVRATARPHELKRALERNDRVNIIAEFKRRSPSKGEIKSGADAASIAKAYEAGGAAAVSVLTEEDHFDGSLDDLRSVRQAISVPILRKDFIFDEYQAYESAAAGADALLLIVASLEESTLTSLRRITEDELGIDALVEVHNRKELDRAIGCGSKLIGVNNRDLKTFHVSLETSRELAELAPEGTILVSESGIESEQDIAGLRRLGFHGSLIGETLMRADDSEGLLRRLISIRIDNQ